MLEGSMQVKDLPEIWNAKYQQYLGVTPPTDSDGCLQDIHWSGGSIGYFPTYSMGNLLSYQIWNTLTADIGDQDSNMAAGDFSQILNWLTEKIYSQGKRHTPKALVQKVCGKPIDATDYLTGITAKYRTVYEI